MNNCKNRQGLAAAAALAFGVLVLAVPEAAPARAGGRWPLLAGLVAVPYYWLFELLAPLLEGGDAGCKDASTRQLIDYMRG